MTILRPPLTRFPSFCHPTCFAQALVDQRQSNILLLNNITVDPNLWPPGGVTLRRDVTIGAHVNACLPCMFAFPHAFALSTC